MVAAVVLSGASAAQPDWACVLITAIVYLLADD